MDGQLRGKDFLGIAKKSYYIIMSYDVIAQNNRVRGYIVLVTIQTISRTGMAEFEL